MSVFMCVFSSKKALIGSKDLVNHVVLHKYSSTDILTEGSGYTLQLRPRPV